jgi:Ca-activated chloride channel family protein
MSNNARLAIALSFLGLVAQTAAQSLGGPGLAGPTNDKFTSHRSGTAPFDISGMGLEQLNARMMLKKGTYAGSPLQNPALTVSQLDLRAPKDARREFDKGFQQFSGKQFQQAAQHFLQALTIYPDYVAAHNALGSSYLALHREQDARNEFAKAAVLDPHLPAPFLNLCYAELALRNYSSAQIAAQKVANMAPLDFSGLSALAYAQLMNKDYDDSVATADKIHSQKEDDHAIVHLYAAAASENQGDIPKAIAELQDLVKEDPKSEAAAKARELLDQLKNAPQPTDPDAVTPRPSQAPAQSRLQQEIELQNAQDAREQAQLTDAESMCESCQTEAAQLLQTSSSAAGERGWTLHSNVDEVAVWFVATDHGKPIQGLTQSEVTVRDAGKPPASVTGFRTESELPLRLGLIIDTSESVARRFKFEQAAASDFVQKVLTDKEDRAFVVGVSNSVLLVQDFTSDNSKISDAIAAIAPAGGTALWDAVSFAADKLSSTSEAGPVAKVLVVISDGRDNSSRSTLKEAINAAEHKDVTIYTVSTNDIRYVSTAFLDSIILGNRALKSLADHTGGSAFVPGSIGNLTHSLDDLQEFIRSRYALSYKPALLKHNDQYRPISITAEKSGHKLRVYARKGYYAEASFKPKNTP